MNPIHLHSKVPVTRLQTTNLQRQHCLNEAEMPKGDGTQMALRKILHYLHEADRYKKTGDNLSGLFLYDVAYLAGAYVPRVWYSDASLSEEGIGKEVSDERLRELNNNDLFDWFKIYSREFGWKPVADFVTAQEYASVGNLVVIISQARNRYKHGLVSVIVPQDGKPVDIPVQCRPSKRIAGSKIAQTRKDELLTFQNDWYNGPLYANFKIYVNFLK